MGNNNDTITSFNGLVDSWTNRMMELDHKVTSNRRSIEGLENQIEDTYKEMEEIEKAAYDLLGDKVHFNLYENEDSAIRISFKSNSMVEPLVNIVKDRKIQLGKEPNKSERYLFTKDDEKANQYLKEEMLKSSIRFNEQYEKIIKKSNDIKEWANKLGSTITDNEGNYSSIRHGVIGEKEDGSPKFGVAMEVGKEKLNIDRPDGEEYIQSLNNFYVNADKIGASIQSGKIDLETNSIHIPSLTEKFGAIEKRLGELEERFMPTQDPVAKESE